MQLLNILQCFTLEIMTDFRLKLTNYEFLRLRLPKAVLTFSILGANVSMD